MGINTSGIKVFKGVPFAKPPVGELRWKEPQPVENWEGTRQATEFGPNAMQTNVFGDMNFSTSKMSEDCLYLNIWTPAKNMNEKLPVLVYFHGGGLVAGSGSEPRYAGESMARNGIVSITVNYRLGIFGFLSHPALSEESEHHASGNYGLLDQVAALKWIKNNISAFGGAPDKITIAGESAGSVSVSSLMCSPLSKDLVDQVIGSSGSLMGTRFIATQKEAENLGVEITLKFGYKSLKDLRAASGEDLLKIQGSFVPNIDGYFLPKSPYEIYANGEQAHIPLLVGWNSQEMVPMYLLGNKPSTFANLKEYVVNRFGDDADAILEQYKITDDASVFKGGIDLASDLFIAYSTWKWADIHQQTGGSNVFRYLYGHPRPEMVSSLQNKSAGLAGGIQDSENDNAMKLPKLTGEIHSADIEYAMGPLPTNRIYDWQPEDFAVSEIFQSYYINFIKTGSPNGLGLPEWSVTNLADVPPVMQINIPTMQIKDEQLENRYKFLDEILNKN